MVLNSDSNLVIQFIKQRKPVSIGIVLLGFFSQLFTILLPVSIGKYYELLFDYRAARVKLLSFIPDWFWNSVPRFLIFFSLLILFRFLFYFFYQVLHRRESELFIKEVKDYLFNYQLHIKSQIYREKGIGKYLLRYTGDINSLKNLYLKGSLSVIIDIIILIISFIWLYSLNQKGAVAILVLSCTGYLIIRVLNKKVEAYSLLKRNRSSGQLSFVTRTLNGIISVLLFNKQRVELKKYKKKTTAIHDAALDYNKWLIGNRGFINFLQYGTLMIILYLFYLDTANENSISGGGLISFILLYITILPVIRRMFALETVYKLGNISLNKLNDILKIEQETIQKGNSLTVNNPRVEMEELQFNSAPPINFRSNKMKMQELVLPIGVEGIDLLLAITRVTDDYQGSISINKENINTFSPKSLRANIAIASCHLPLVGRSVYEAITAFRSSKIKEDVRKQFGAIQSTLLPGSHITIDDKIGENGSNLSGIQRELLCFARGCLLDKRILIIDEFPLLEMNAKERYHIYINEMEKATIIKLKR